MVAGVERKLRIVCLSDTHDRHGELGSVPTGDILLHAGDWSTQGTVDEEASFRSFMEALPHRHKIFINGNHERVCAQSTKEEIQNRFPGCTYLEDDAVEVEGVKIYGSPWCDIGAYFARGEDAAAKWAAIPEDIDILLTHLPPSGILDLAHEPFVSGAEAPPPPPAAWNVPEEVMTSNLRLSLMDAIRKTKPKEDDPTRRTCGCCGAIHPDRQHWGGPELRERVERIAPPVHVFGHVHEQRGFERRGHTLFLNAACYDELPQGAFVFDLLINDSGIEAQTPFDSKECK